MNDDALRASAFQFAPHSSAILDAERGRILACNRAFSVLLGFSEEELVDRPIDVIVPEDHRNQMRAALRATRTSPLLGYETTLPLCREDGAHMRVRMRCRLVDDGDGGPVRAIIAIEELTPNTDHQDAFFAMLAHELRNRLSNFRLAVQILDREDVPAGSRWRWGLSVMDQQVGELTQLTDDLLDVSRMARGQLSPRHEPVDLTALVRAVARAPAANDAVPADSAHHADHANDTKPSSETSASHSVTDLVEEDGPARTVFGDPQRLMQVVSLLVELARAPDGDGVHLTLTDDGERARLAVRGDGIDPHLFPNDLDLFAAAARAAAARPGLGLEPLLVSGLVARMDGQLFVRRGTVELSMPLAIGARTAPTARVSPPPHSTSAPHSPTLPPHSAGQLANGALLGNPKVGARCQVLVVDDNRGAANTLALLLSSAGHAVEQANDGERGLQMALQARPKVALLDLKLPGMDGYALARRLRAHFGSEIRLIALTGLDDPDDRARASEAGFDHHLVKPIDVEVLKSLL